MSLLARLGLAALVAGGLGIGIWGHHEQKLKEEKKTPPVMQANLSAGNSDADLQKDMLQIDAQLKAVDQNSEEVDKGMNDKPVTQ